MNYPQLDCLDMREVLRVAQHVQLCTDEHSPDCWEDKACFVLRLLEWIFIINDERRPTDEGVVNPLITEEIVDWYRRADEVSFGLE